MHRNERNELPKRGKINIGAEAKIIRLQDILFVAHAFNHYFSFFIGGNAEHIIPVEIGIAVSVAVLYLHLYTSQDFTGIPVNDFPAKGFAVFVAVTGIYRTGKNQEQQENVYTEL